MNFSNWQVKASKIVRHIVIENQIIASVSERPVYRRHFIKQDGRDLRLYGYSPHDLSPLRENFFDVPRGGEFRYHPLRQEWNVYAAHRQNRTYKPSLANDPLAPSKPNLPPTEIPFEDFEVAVFDNKFASLHNNAPRTQTSVAYKTRPALGHCDVIVYGPEAQGNLHSIGQSNRRLLLSAWSDRYQTLFDEGHKFVLPFENRGDEVGVTLHHPHGQIYAFPNIPNIQKSALLAFQGGYDLITEVRKFGPDYKIASAGGMSAFSPPFARFPYEVWITPDKFSAGPWAFDETQQDGFAHLLGDVTRKYDALFKRPTAYMLSLHAAPAGHEDVFHFTAQFYPLLRSKSKVKYLASVEQSTGVFTVDIMPETAAKILRDL